MTLLTLLLVSCFTATKGSIYAKDNLVAWCIVPFDAAQRGPEARAKMLADINAEEVHHLTIA